MGRNGGGWAHYVGQEKCRPLTGWRRLAMALDWQRPPRQMIGTAFWYTHTDQWRYDGYRADALASPLARGRPRRPAHGRHDRAPPPGWAGCRPTRRSTATPSTWPTRPRRAGQDGAAARGGRQTTGRLGSPRRTRTHHRTGRACLTLWRANLLGSSSKGNEYFLRHLLGTHYSLRAEQTPPDRRPRDVVWRDEAPEGKLDLLVSLDFRMTSSTLLSDIVLPAATWYEKHDLSTTDMHPFVHAFTPAIDPPWEARTDFDAFHAIARRSARWPRTHLGVRRTWSPSRCSTTPPGETAQPGGRVAGLADGRGRGGARPHDAGFVVVERDYAGVATSWPRSARWSSASA